MKKIVFICCILANSILMAQQALSPTVVNSAGASAKSGVFSLDYSVGEAAVTYHESGGKKLSQGFIQPFDFVVPIADFVADQTSITVGQTVNFTDKSTNSPNSWTWSFPGGFSSNSLVQNPSAQYNTAGVFTVTLIASNSAGSNTVTKTGYIIVNSIVIAPVADFTADNTIINIGDVVKFTDKSINNPTSWTWSFPGGIPATSSLQNPSVIYPTKGCFNVTLIVENGSGQNTLKKEKYICDKTSDVDDIQQSLVQIYPNPTSEFLNIKFTEPSSEKVTLELLDLQSKVLRYIETTKDSPINFDVSVLPNQVYILRIQDDTYTFYKKVIVQK